MATFAELVNETASRLHAAGRFGDRKVYISAVYDRMLRNGDWDCGLDTFKETLLTLNQLREVTLARADLPAAMDPDMLADSHIADLGCDFHFVIDPTVK